MLVTVPGVVRRGRARAHAAGRDAGRAIRRSCCSRSRRPRSTRGSIGARQKLAPGERVLVFDVGGGTTDFTLIEVDANGDGFTRTAVGDHLLLGGDNLDLTLAKIVEQRVVASTGKKLDALQWHGLVHACRLAKETLLGDDAAREGADRRPGARREADRRHAARRGHARRARHRSCSTGSSRSSRRTPRSRAAAAASRSSACPTRPIRRSRAHLATFLARHGAERDRSRAVQRRRDDADVAARARARSDRAVARRARRASCRPRCPSSRSRKAPRTTASSAAASRRGSRAARRARSTSASRPRARAASRRRTTSATRAGADGRVPRAAGPRGWCARPARARLQARHESPVSFRLYSSTTRDDQPGALVPIGDGKAETLDDGSDLLELPPIVTVLRARGRGEVTVRLEVHITELGALEIRCVDRELRTRPGSSRSTCARAAPRRPREARPMRRRTRRPTRRRRRSRPRSRPAPASRR